jgi:hypothetical protein
MIEPFPAPYCGSCGGHFGVPCFCRLENCIHHTPCQCSALDNPFELIINDWMRQNPNADRPWRELMHLGTFSSDTGSPVGTFDAVVVFGLESIVTDNLWSETIAGYTFNYNHGYQIRVWWSESGRVTTLGGALDWILTEDDISKIHAEFNSLYHGRHSGEVGIMPLPDVIDGSWNRI